MHLPGIKHDERWAESQRIAEELLAGGYEELRDKYLDILYFHATAIRPSWRSEKRQVAKIGGHIFYAERQ
jgi:spore germination cell wall hydrolase CwlJ-like protein